MWRCGACHLQHEEAAGGESERRRVGLPLAQAGREPSPRVRYFVFVFGWRVTVLAPLLRARGRVVANTNKVCPRRVVEVSVRSRFDLRIVEPTAVEL